MFSSEHNSTGHQRIWLIISLLALLAVSSWRFIVGADWLVNMVLAFSLSGVGLLLWFEWRKLRSIRQAYDMAMLAAHDGFWEWNPITKELHTGTRLLEILGYQHDFLPDTHAWLKLVHPDDISIYNNAVSEHLKGNSNFFYCKYRVRASNGSYIWVASRGIAVRDRRGRAYQMVGFTPDRDYRYLEVNRFLRQLHPEIVAQSEARIAAIGGTVIRDPATDILRVNDEFSVSLVLARCHTYDSGSLRWKIRFDTSLRPDITVAIRLDPENQGPLDYYLLPRLDFGQARIHLAEQNAVEFDSYRFETLDYLYGMAGRTRIRRAA